MSGIKVDINIDVISEDVGRVVYESLEAIAGLAVEKAIANSVFIEETGHLRNSIRSKKTSKTTKNGEAVWLVQAKAPHAHLVENGHVMVSKTGEVLGQVPPHPFLQPAVDSAMADAERIAAQYLKNLNIKA